MWHSLLPLPPATSSRHCPRPCCPPVWPSLPCGHVPQGLLQGGHGGVRRFCRLLQRGGMILHVCVLASMCTCKRGRARGRNIAKDSGNITPHHCLERARSGACVSCHDCCCRRWVCTAAHPSLFDAQLPARVRRYSRYRMQAHPRYYAHKHIHTPGKARTGPTESWCLAQRHRGERARQLSFVSGECMGGNEGDRAGLGQTPRFFKVMMSRLLPRALRFFTARSMSSLSMG